MIWTPSRQRSPALSATELKDYFLPVESEPGANQALPRITKTPSAVSDRKRGLQLELADLALRRNLRRTDCSHRLPFPEKGPSAPHTPSRAIMSPALKGDFEGIALDEPNLMHPADEDVHAEDTGLLRVAKSLGQ